MRGSSHEGRPLMRGSSHEGRPLMRGVFDRIFEREAKDVSILTHLPDFLTYGPAKSGQAVNYQTALMVTAVLACAQVLCNGIAQVPWRVMKASADGLGATVATDHPLYKLLNRRPNDYQTSFEFRSTIVLHLALARNAFVYISRGAGNRILELIPLEPGRVSVTRHADLSLTYTVTSEAGGSRTLPASSIWHLRGLSWNGWMGMEVVKLAREAIGLSLALEESHANLHKNGVQTSGTYAFPGKLTEEQHVKLTAWIKKMAAAANSGNPLVLDNGATWLAQQMTGVDAQHLESREHQVVEICRSMNVQPMMVFAVNKPTYNSAEQLFNAHRIHTLAPLGELIEQSADVHLLGVDDDTGFYTAFDFRAFARGSLKDQAEYYKAALAGRAWMTQDEVRDDCDTPRKGGKASELLDPPNQAKAPAGAKLTPDDIPEPDDEDAE